MCVCVCVCVCVIWHAFWCVCVYVCAWLSMCVWVWAVWVGVWVCVCGGEGMWMGVCVPLPGRQVWTGSVSMAPWLKAGLFQQPKSRKTHTDTHPHTPTHSHPHTHPHTPTHTPTHTPAHTNPHTHPQTQIHTHPHIPTHKDMRTQQFSDTITIHWFGWLHEDETNCRPANLIKGIWSDQSKCWSQFWTWASSYKTFCRIILHHNGFWSNGMVAET